MPELTDFELRSMPGLWRWYADSGRRMGFRAQSPGEAVTWQQTLRETVLPLLGELPEPIRDFDAQVIETAEVEGIRRELIVIQVASGEYMPCYVLWPHAATPPYKPVIALHGHGTWGARGIIGMADSDMEREFIGIHNYDYALQLARRGYLVFAPVLRGFAERLEERSQPVDSVPDRRMWTSSCQPLGLNALLCGKTLLGLRISDTTRLIDYIRSRPEPMTDGLGCVGLSGGGTVALFTTALDQRISTAIISGYFNTFRDSIMSIDHCVCNYVPGLVTYAEMADIAGLIAPRPVLVVAGQTDPIFPVEATRQALTELRSIYHCFGKDDCLESDIFDGGHRWNGEKAYGWLERWL